MHATNLQCNLPAEKTTVNAIDLLTDWLQHRLSSIQTEWLDARLQKIMHCDSDRDLHITLGMIPRKLGRDDLQLTDRELAQAEHLSGGWRPVNWSIDTAARIWILCHLAQAEPDRFSNTIADLCRTADLAESIAFYSGLAVYPTSASLDHVVAEGLRSNVKAIFEAIAHNNPYPAMNFSDHRWNHMILKALFIDSSLAPITGLDERANAELAEILCDYAHERWAAGRTVSIELWRCVGPFATDSKMDDLLKVINSGPQRERYAGLLAMSMRQSAAATRILNDHADVYACIKREELTWENVDSFSCTTPS